MCVETARRLVDEKLALDLHALWHHRFTSTSLTGARPGARVPTAAGTRAHRTGLEPRELEVLGAAQMNRVGAAAGDLARPLGRLVDARAAGHRQRSGIARGGERGRPGRVGVVRDE